VTVEDALRRSLVRATRGEVSFARDFQGFPGTVHGGAVAGLFYRVTTPEPPVRLRMDLLRGVPTETPLALVTSSERAIARHALTQDERRLAEAELTRSDLPAVDPRPLLAAWQGRPDAGDPVPATATCLACGTANPLGLALRLRFDDRFLWQEYAPPAHYRAAGGSLHPTLATVALDEMGWWLGALAQQECGVTTEVTVSVFQPLPFGPLLLLGDRSAVRPDEDPRGRYLRARACLLAPDGGLLAAAEVRFAGSPAYTKRLLQPFLETTRPETLFRIFPTAGRLGGRARPDPAPPP
jgi:hypothetical protein